MKCAKCKVEAVEVSMLMSTFMGCPVCKEEVKPQELTWANGATVTFADELDANYTLGPCSITYTPPWGQLMPNISDYERFLAKKFNVYASWNVLAEEFDAVDKNGVITRFTYDYVVDLYNQENGAKA